MARKYDFSGWASRYDMPCTDGRTIRKDAFKDMDGETVPLVWGHEHDSPESVIGNAYIEHRDEGPYIYGSFNDSPAGQSAKEAVRHGDVKYLSIWANRLKEQAHNVLHGVIREVSLVYGGANPGAYIDHAVLAHGDGTYDLSDDEAIIMVGGEIIHADADEDEDKESGEGAKEMAKEGGKTIKDVLDTFNEDQKKVLYYLVAEAAKGEGSSSDDDEDEDDDDVKHSEEEGPDMKYNAFDDGTKRNSGFISHADQEEILKLAKDTRVGTWKNAMKAYAEENELMHADAADAVNGFDDTDPLAETGIDSMYTSFTAMLPEYKDVRPGAPELVTNDQGWISTVMAKTHKSPISRIRTGQVDIRNAEQLRAKGYQKGNKKALTGQIKLARRTTDPQTVYVRNSLHRDDIVDITDFDYVQYLYNIDRMMLNEELATAIMLGDGREDSDPDKIFPEHIRPIWTDDELYTMHVDLDKSNIQGSNTTGYFGENYITAEAMINTCLYAREKFKGTGTPDMFITPHMLNVMLLARDRNGRRIYSSKAELATALNVGNIYTAEQFEGKTRVEGTGVSAKNKKLLALIVNLADYSLGATKGGQVTHFTQFDIDFNQQKSLLETRVSGAMTRIYAAIAIEEDVELTNDDGEGDEEQTDTHD